MAQFLNLFQAYGIELEYMIVDDKTLKALPITDQVFKDVAGKIVSDVDDGVLEWSNELVMHVVELKVAKPVSSLKNLDEEFHRGVGRLNSYLKKYSAKLMPTAMHPFIDPFKETKLWPHDNNEVYASYNRIFDCRGHGWSNVQSAHINLPFENNEEFVKLHRAIRVILPLVPALAASSPMHDSKLQTTLDSRLEFYKKNQEKVPMIAGEIIPEQVESIREYHEKILAQIYKDIESHDSENILKEDWLNSRGAIARFSRQTIEIRLMDIQEAPLGDLAITEFLVHLLKKLCDGSWIGYQAQHELSTSLLKKSLDQTIIDADQSNKVDSSYYQFWGLESAQNMSKLLSFLYEKTEFRKAASSIRISNHLELILNEGCLAQRMKKSLKATDPHSLFQTLSHCLADNQSFKVRS
jgi:carboxylate-amine ligase